jgi:hypothetical protein
MIDLSRHRFDALGHDGECVLYRAPREEDGSRVLVLAPAVQYPGPAATEPGNRWNWAAFFD